MMQDDDGGLVANIAKAIREEVVRQYREDERRKCPAGAAFYEEHVAPGLVADAALSAIERKGYTLVPPQKIEGATFVCELPSALGAVTGMRVEGDRVVCDTASGIPFVLSASPKQG
jgi:hypothetical protein